jgi:pyruvate dehydrogenase E1 component
MYLLREGAAGDGPRVQLLGSGAILREALAAAELLRADFGVEADVWSVTSYTELHREGERVARRNALHPGQAREQSWVERCLGPRKGPVVAASDYVKLYADQIRGHVPRRYVAMGADGFGRSDTREALRRFFEIDRGYLAFVAIKALADDGVLPVERVREAIAKYGIDTDKPQPRTV